MNNQYNYLKTLRDKGLLNSDEFAKRSIQLYSQDSSDFELEQVDEIEKAAKSIGAPFKRNLEDDENALVSGVNQLVSGVIEGFTTFGYADDPKTETEAILNKMGHLIGFAPDIIAGVLSFGTAPLAKRGALKGINLLRANAARNVEKGLGNIGQKYIPQLVKKTVEKEGKKEITKFQLRSVPMRVADFFVDNAEAAIGKSDIIKNSFLGRKLPDGFKDMMRQSAHLSAAMAISSRKAAVSGDWDAVKESAKHGAYAGAVFGSIGNYLKIGDLFASRNPALQTRAYGEVGKATVKLMEQAKMPGLSPVGVEVTNMVTRGIAGSAFTGVPLTAQDAPASDQVYEYLLGFFFGASGRPRYEVEVNKAFRAEGDKIWRSVITDIQKDGSAKTETVPVGKVKDLDAYEGFSPAAKRYAEQREVEIFDNYYSSTFNKDSKFVRLVLEHGREKINDLPKGKLKDDITSGRLRNKLLAEGNVIAADKMQKEYESQLSDTLAQREIIKDIDKSIIKVGEKIKVFTENGSIEDVTVHKKFKNGNVRIKNSEGLIYNLDNSQYISKNPYNPKIIISKEISPTLGGKEIGTLTKKESDQLNKDLTESYKKVVETTEKAFVITPNGEKKTRKQIEKSLNNFKRQLKLLDTPSKREDARIAKQIMDIYDSKSGKGTVIGRHIKTGKKYKYLEIDVSKDTPAEREYHRELYRQQWKAKSGKNQKDGIAYNEKLLAELNANAPKEKLVKNLRKIKSLATSAREQTIKQSVIPSGALTSARKVAQDPNQITLDFEREVDYEVNVVDPSSDVAYNIVRNVTESLGEGFKSLDITYQLRKAAQESSNKQDFITFAKTFYDKKFTNQQLTKIWFNTKDVTKQTSQMFQANLGFQTETYNQEVIINGKRVDLELQYSKGVWDANVSDVPKSNLKNGQNLDVVSAGTFHNKIKGDNFEIILHLRNKNGDLQRANQVSTTPTAVEEISANIQKNNQRFIYYTHSSNNSFVTRPIVEMPISKELLNWFRSGFYSKEWMFNTSSFIVKQKGNKLPELLRHGVKKVSSQTVRQSVLEQLNREKQLKLPPVYESPFWKNPDLYYKEKISRATYLLQDAGMLPQNLNDVTLSQWTKAFNRHQGFIVGTGKEARYNKSGAEPLYKNVIDFVKYTKTFHGGTTVDRIDVDNYLKGRKLRIAVVKDNFNRAGEMTSDGGMHWMKLWRDVLQKAKGSNKDTNYNKAMIQKEADFKNDRGLVIIKQAERQASDAMERFGRLQKLDGIAFESTLKTNSRHQIGELAYNEKTDSYRFKVRPEIIELEPENIRIITSEVEVPNKDAIQMHIGAADIRNAQSSPKFIAAQRKMIHKSIDGSQSYMKKYKDAVKKYGAGNFDTIDGKKIKLQDIHLYEVIEVLNNNSNSKLGVSILKSMYGEKEYMKIVERGFVEQEADFKALDSINDILVNFDYDPLVLMMHGNKRYVEQTITTYARNRLTNLRVPSGMSYPRLQSQDAALWRKLRNKGLTYENFMLNDGHKKDKIKIFGTLRKTFKRKTVSLEELWNQYKSTKDTKLKENLKDVMENFVMNRSPVGNREGVLNLTFAGFTGQPGKGVHVTPKNMERLGGADTDGDAVAIYHGTEKDFASAFKPKKTTEKPVNKTDVNAFPNWGYKRNLDELKKVYDITNPKLIYNQGYQNSVAAGNIGQSTNFNKHVNDLFTFIKHSNDSFPINSNGDVHLRINKGKGEGITVLDPQNKSKKIVLKTLDDHLNFFDKYESDISLNLDLDGSKNSVNPPVKYKFDDMIRKHFILYDTTANKQLPWPVKHTEPVLDWGGFKNGVVFTGDYVLETSSVEGIKNVNVNKDLLKKELFSKNDKDKFTGEQKAISFTRNLKSLIDKIKNNLKEYQNTFLQGLGKKNIAELTKAQKKIYDDTTLASLKVMQSLKQGDALYREYLADSFIVAKDGVDAKKQEVSGLYTRGLPKNLITKGKKFYAEDYQPFREYRTFKIKDILDKNKFNSVNISKPISDNLSKMYDFNKALTKGYGEGADKLVFNELGIAAESFRTAFERTADGSEIYNNHLLDVADIIADSFTQTRHDNVSVDIRVIPPSQYTNTIVNLGKAHAKIKKLPFYRHLKKKNLLSDDLLLNELYFDKISGKDKEAATVAVRELKELWESRIGGRIQELYNENKGIKESEFNKLANQEQHILQQMTSVAALNNLAVRYNVLRTSLFNSGIEPKLIDAKIADMLQFSYDVRLNDSLQSEGYLKGFDVDANIKSYRDNELSYIGKTTLKPEQKAILSNVFSKTLLSDILPEIQNRRTEEYMEAVKQEYIAEVKKDEKGRLLDIDKEIKNLEFKIKSRQLKQAVGKDKAKQIQELQRYGKNNIKSVRSAIKSGVNPLTAYEDAGKFNRWSTEQGSFNTSLFRKESIPMSHKKEFMREIRDIFDTATTINADNVSVYLDLPPVKPFTSLKNKIKVAAPSQDTRKRSTVTKLVEATLDGTQPVIELNRTSNKDKDQMSILFEQSELSDMLNILKNTESQLKFKDLAEASILSKVSNKSIKEQAVFMDNPQEMVKIYDLTKSRFKEGEVAAITKTQADLLETWKGLIDKNPRLLMDLEGNVAEFFSNIGVKGKARLGVEMGQMTPLEFEAFTRMVQDIYIDTDSRLTSRIKMFEKIQGIKDAGNPIEVNAAKKKSPFNRGVHYWFYNSVGLYQLQKREMLSYQKNNIPIYDRISGETNLKQVITPINTIELNVDVIDHGKRVAAALQDHEKKRKQAIFDFKESGDNNLKRFDLELETIATEFRQAKHRESNVKADRFTKDYYDAAFERAKLELKEIELLTDNKIVIKDVNNLGNLKTISVRDYITELNKATDSYLEWYKENSERGMEKVGNITQPKKEFVDKVLSKDTGFITDGKLLKLFRNILEKSISLDSTAKNMLGMNQLQYIMHHHSLREMVNRDLKLDVQDFVDKKKPVPKVAIEYLKKLQSENKFRPINQVVDKNGKVSVYWPQIGWSNHTGNSTNIENHIKYLAQEHIKDVKKMGVNAFMPKTKVEYLTSEAKNRNLKEFEKKSLQEFITSKTHMLSVQSYNDTGMSERLVMFNNKSMPAAFVNSSNQSRSEHILLGYEKTSKALDQYTSQFIKSYTDTFSSIRGTTYIDRFIRKNSMGDIEHTQAWGNYMRRSLNTKLGIDSFVDLNLDGYTVKQKKLLEQYIAADLNQSKMVENRDGSKLSYREKEFIRKVNNNIAINVNRIYDSGLKGKELEVAIQEARLNEANKLNDVKNINKIKRYGTAFHVVSDEAAVNTIRSIEENFGKAFGMKEGEFSFFKELRSKKDPISGEKVVMNEAERRMATAQRLNAFSTFEGRYELMSLLFHPKTMVANFYGGGTNIYADVGGDIFRKALSEEYLIGEIFGNATYEGVDPITRKVIKIPIKNMKDIERFFVQKGLLEGMYLEEVGLTKGLEKAQVKRFSEALAKRFGKWEKENPELSENPRESEKALKLTINQLQKRYNVGESAVQLGAKPMQYSERMLRRTAAVAHYLNARQTALPLIEKGKMSWDSPYLIEMARKGIEASQYIYHSAFRTNYSNTSLGRVMTRFHPYAWNSVKRRKNLYKEASYTKFLMNTDAQQRFSRQFTADLMSMALASIFVGTIFEYALSPPMSWMQDTSQWLFGSKEDRQKAFFSAWPHTSLAPLQVVTPPISRFVLAPASALLNGEWDNFMKYQFATWLPAGRLLRDGYRIYQSPSMSFDFLSGIPLHRIGQEVKKNRTQVEKDIDAALSEQIDDDS